MNEAEKLIGKILQTIDDAVWGVPLIVLIMATGIYLTIRLKGIQIRHLPIRYLPVKRTQEKSQKSWKSAVPINKNTKTGYTFHVITHMTYGMYILFFSTI